MPKWGLNLEMRDAEPYGIKHELLAPSKTITDPIQGDVRLMELERLLVDSPSFQRLRRVSQLGTTSLVYPGATHTRFAHSLGTLAAAQMLLDLVLEQRQQPDAHPDLFAEWEADGGDANKRIAEAIVLTRLGALLHDLCHVPFGHSVEDELRLLTPHDENEERFEILWDRLEPTARGAIEAGTSLRGKSLYDDLVPIILAAKTKPEISEDGGDDPGVADISYPFAQDIVGNTISADLIDYLSRDHRFTGLPAATGNRFLESFYISPSTDRFKPGRMVLKVVRRGRERQDTLTELLKFLRYRYELSERALAHHAKLAADAMVGKLLQLVYDGLWIEELQEIAAADSDLRDRLEGIPTADIDLLRARATPLLKKKRMDEIAGLASARLEENMLRHGDDGLLESWRAQGEERQEDSRWAGVRDLASALLERRLFKPVARMSDRGHAGRLWKKYGRDPNERRKIEQVAARFAGIKPAWHSVLWVPPERMRLKPALVLVDDDKLIDTMIRRERSRRGSGRGTDIYEAHRDLWAIHVFVHPDIRDDQLRVNALLAAIAEQLTISDWDDRVAPVETATVARREAGRRLNLTRAQEDALKDLVPSYYDGPVDLDEKSKTTLDEMVDGYIVAAEELAGESSGGSEPVRGVTDDLEAPVDEPGPDDESQQRLT